MRLAYWANGSRNFKAAPLRLGGCSVRICPPSHLVLSHAREAPKTPPRSKPVGEAHDRSRDRSAILVMKTAEDRLRCDDAEARSITLYSEDGWMLLLVAIILAAVFLFVAVS
jgi:hypothetical protein